MDENTRDGLSSEPMDIAATICGGCGRIVAITAEDLVGEGLTAAIRREWIRQLRMGQAWASVCRYCVDD